MDFLEQRGLPLTEENLATWQEDLEAREQAAKQRNQELRNARAEVVRDFNQLKSKEAELFRARATKSRRVWSRSRFDLFKRFGYNLYEIIIAVNVLMFILSRIVPGLLYWFAFSGINVTYLNEYYRFFTTMFMHGSILHIFFNMYALYYLGGELEEVLGKLKFAILYFGSGIIGAVVTYYVNPFIISVGASGALFGLLGFVLYARVFRYSHVTPAIQSSLLTVLAINLLIALVPGSNIDVWSHVGGLLGGFLIGMIIGPSSRYLRSDSEKTTQITLGVLGIVAVLAVTFLNLRFF